MSRSNSEERESRHKYASAKKRADKKQAEASFSATYLKPPEGMKFFKPKAGIVSLDIIPFTAGEGNPMAEPGMVHYERTYFLHPRISPDGNAYICRRLTFKKKCPVCNMRAQLMKNGEDNEALIKDLAPKERQLFLVRPTKEPELMLWDFSYHLFGKLLDARIRNGDDEDGWHLFFTLEDGKTLKIGFKEKTFGGNTFQEAETIDFKDREPLSEKLLKKAPCLDELLLDPGYDKMEEIFGEFMEIQEGKKVKEDDDEDEDDEKPSKKKSKPAPEDDEDEDSDDEPAPKKKAKPADDEDEDEDSDDSEDDDEDEKPAKKKAKPAPEEDDEDSDDEDSDDDEPEEKPAKGKAPKKKWDDFDKDEDSDDEDDKPAKKKAKPADDDDDEDEDDEPEEKPAKKKAKPADDEDEDEDSDSEDDDEDEEPAPKKKGKAKPADDEDEDDSDDEDEDEDEKPRVKSGKPDDDEDDD